MAEKILTTDKWSKILQTTDISTVHSDPQPIYQWKAYEII